MLEPQAELLLVHVGPEPRTVLPVRMYIQTLIPGAPYVLSLQLVQDRWKKQLDACHR